MQTKKETFVFEAPHGLYLAMHGYHARGLFADLKDQINLTEICKDISWDSDTAPLQGQDMPRWLVKEIPLLTWVTPAMYVSEFFYIVPFMGVVQDWYKLDLTDAQCQKLYALYRSSAEQFWVVADNLKVKNMRSGFRLSIRKQIMSWLSGESEYESPLSPKQVQATLGYNVDLGRLIRSDAHARIRMFV